MAKKDNKARNAEQVSSTPAEKQDVKVTETNKTTSSDGGAASVVVAAIIILLLLAGVGFLVFGLVQSLNNAGRTDGTQTANSDSDSDDNKDSDDDGDSKDDDDADSDSGDDDDDDNNDSDNDDNDSDTEDDDNDTAGGGKTSGETMDKIAMSAAYAAKYPATNSVYRRGNDYAFGDIEGDTYIVKKGDTLWQIAEARYGSGYAWVEIDRANGVFPLLPNGGPNLLPIGYKLTLPDLESR